MAIAEARLNHGTASISHLRRLVGMRVYFDLPTEPAFSELKNLPAFEGLTAAMEQIRTTTLVRATSAIEITDRGFIPEGIAYDAKSGDFFVSSLRERKIARVSSSGTITDFITPKQDGIWGVTGIGVDTRRRFLWACSTAADGDEGYTPADRNNTAVFAFDLDTGKLAGKYPLEKPGKNHFCDSLVVRSDGTVFVSDSQGLIIYRLDPGAHELQVLVDPEAGISPQGLALSQDGTTLFVSNYFSGIYAIDLKSGKVSSVDSRAQQSLAGIDGLMSYGNDLIAIQNGIQPNRVVRLKMSNHGTTVKSIELLEINHPSFGEPTLGVVKGDTLLFVANSAMGQFLRDRQLTALPTPLILKRDLR
jgi:sugar lactone lactonase YvrE